MSGGRTGPGPQRHADLQALDPRASRRRPVGRCAGPPRRDEPTDFSRGDRRPWPPLSREEEQKKTATANVVNSCGEIQAGDIAIPFNQKPIPKFQAAGFDRFAPPSGKNEGLIVTGKEFLNTLGTGDKVYLNIGSSKGVEVGQSYRVYRTFLPGVKDPAMKGNDSIAQYVGSERLNYKLTDLQKRALPRDVIGELVILWVEGKTATGYITMATTEIYSGDQVELK